MHAVRSLHNFSHQVTQNLPQTMSIHGRLAADMALGNLSPAWSNMLPRHQALEPCMPLLWPPHLQSLLPSNAYNLLLRQRRRLSEHWSAFSAAFPDVSFIHYTRAWILVNSRTFLHETPDTGSYPWEDRLALLPIADLFNHADESSCGVSFSTDWYAITTRRSHAEGEELYISYGDHTNDFLLVEYGFIMDENASDKFCLDEAALPRLRDSQTQALSRRHLLGDYMIRQSDGPCPRTKIVMAILSFEDNAGWESVLRMSEGDQAVLAAETRPMEILYQLLREVIDISRARQEKASTFAENGQGHQRDVLVARWRQIEDHLDSVLDDVVKDLEILIGDADS